MCVICRAVITDSAEEVKLTKKGCTGIHNASASGGDSLIVAPGQMVHTECRRAYYNENVIERDLKKETDNTVHSTPQTLRSQT